MAASVSPTGSFSTSVLYTSIGIPSTPHARPRFIPFTTRLISPHRTALRDSGILAVSITLGTPFTQSHSHCPSHTAVPSLTTPSMDTSTILAPSLRVAPERLSACFRNSSARLWATPRSLHRSTFTNPSNHSYHKAQSIRRSISTRPLRGSTMQLKHSLLLFPSFVAIHFHRFFDSLPNITPMPLFNTFNFSTSRYLCSDALATFIATAASLARFPSNSPSITLRRRLLAFFNSFSSA